jgi:N-acetylglucosaminyl-diphospho-decaprenol L-rhamnosyltransferase
MTHSSIDVVIVTYACVDVLEQSIRAARAVQSVRDVVVVDHGNDGSAELATELGCIVERDPSNPGFGAGQNRGFARTEAPFVLLLNPDAVITPVAIERGLACLMQSPRVAAVQGAIFGADGRPERSQGAELGALHLLGRALGLRRFIDQPALRALVRRTKLADHVDRVPAAARSVDALAATALLVRRQAFVDVGGFDESYFLYGEDLDLCRSLRARGWSLLALPDRWATHQSGHSSGSWGTRELNWWTGTLRFAARWWTTRAWIAARMAAVVMGVRVIIADRSLLRRSWRQFVVAPRRVRLMRQVPRARSTARNVRATMRRSSDSR